METVKNKEEFHEESEHRIKNRVTSLEESNNGEDVQEEREEEEVIPKSMLERQLDIDTHEDIEENDKHFKGPRILKSRK